MKVLLIAVALLISIGGGSEVVRAGETAVNAYATQALLLDPGDAAQTLPGLGAGISYRPTYTDDKGAEQTSDLLFIMGITPTSDMPYGSVMVDYRFAKWQGIDWLFGPGVGMLREDSGIYSLGAVGELRAEFHAGANPLFFTIGSGYLWRNSTEDLPDPANVPFYFGLGIRTQ